MNLKKRSSALVVAAAAGLLGVGGFGASQAAAQSAPVFDWSVTDTNPAPGYTAAPFLTDTSAASVRAYLLSQPSSATLAVKVCAPISDATAALVFGSSSSPVPYHVKFVFADMELANNAQDELATAKLVSQVHGSGSNSTGAFIGQFNLSAANNAGIDGTRPTQGSIPSAASFAAAFNQSSYANAHVNMSTPALYPGGPDFATGTASGGPDIRSALFILPIDRLTFSTTYASGGAYDGATSAGPGDGPVFSPGNYQNIPWISRFNNWGNNALNNIGGTAAAQGYKYAFQTSNQLLSRGDFSAQVLQYRLRGATSFNLFNYGNGTTQFSSVIGYTPAQERTDALNGWNYSTNSNGTANSVLSGILSRSYAFANMVNKVPGPTASSGAISSAVSGMMLSGVYDKTFSGGAKNMVLLLSNMSEQTKSVYFKQMIGGASIDLMPNNGKLDQLETIAPGTHELLTFTLNTSANAWVLNDGSITSGGKTYYGQSIFASSDANGDRAGIGVPEPTSLGLLGLAGLGLLGRRRRSM